MLFFLSFQLLPKQLFGTIAINYMLARLVSTKMESLKEMEEEYKL